MTLGEHPDFSPDYRHLMIIEDSVSVDITPEGIRAVSTTPSLFSKEVRRAVVCRSLLAFGIMRMFQLLKGDEGEQTYVTRDISDARRWLDLN